MISVIEVGKIEKVEELHCLLQIAFTFVLMKT